MNFIEFMDSLEALGDRIELVDLKTKPLERLLNALEADDLMVNRNRLGQAYETELNKATSAIGVSRAAISKFRSAKGAFLMHKASIASISNIEDGILDDLYNQLFVIDESLDIQFLSIFEGTSAAITLINLLREAQNLPLYNLSDLNPRHIEFRYISHARARMVQRRIAEAQVEKTVHDPDRWHFDPDVPGRVVAERDTSAGNFIRVVYAEEQAEGGLRAVIITAIRITP